MISHDDKDIHQNESLPQKQDANRESERNEKQDEYLSSMKRIKRFISPRH
jgi:hypothetical protein